MDKNKIDEHYIFQIASMGFKTVVAEVAENQPLTLRLPVDSGVQGFIVLLQQSLPAIY